MITNICAIRRYSWPQYLINPEQDVFDDTPDATATEIIARLNDPESDVRYRILEDGVMGWGSHNTIIRVTSDYGDADYLATIEGGEPMA